jgi:hypothetical protein
LLCHKNLTHKETVFDTMRKYPQCEKDSQMAESLDDGDYARMRDEVKDKKMSSYLLSLGGGMLVGAAIFLAAGALGAFGVAAAGAIVPGGAAVITTGFLTTVGQSVVAAKTAGILASIGATLSSSPIIAGIASAAAGITGIFMGYKANQMGIEAQMDQRELEMRRKSTNFSKVFEQSQGQGLSAAQAVAQGNIVAAEMMKDEPYPQNVRQDGGTWVGATGQTNPALQVAGASPAP